MFRLPQVPEQAAEREGLLAGISKTGETSLLVHVIPESSTVGLTENLNTELKEVEYGSYDKICPIFPFHIFKKKKNQKNLKTT